ncbi:MAG: hemolysin family protein [Eubacteriales bacterium]|nr:hemolysin family protein [Eubacteriales bacterium]
MKDDPAHLSRDLSIIIICIALMLILKLAWTAFDSVSRSKIKALDDDIYDGKKKRLLKLLEKPDRYRFTDNFLCSVLFALAFLLVYSMDFANLYHKIGWLICYAAAATSLGIIFPSKVASQHSESIALSMSGLQGSVNVIFTPVRVVLTIIANLFLRLFGQSTDPAQKEFSEDDVMQMLEVGQKTGQINEEGRRMIGSIFRFDDELAYEIMTPRTDVFLIDVNDPQEEYLDELMSLRYSRIPCCEGEPDNIIGVLNIKDYLIKAREEGFGSVDIKPILRKPYLVPETKNINSLFLEMRQDKQHISILIDEYGGFSGIVTMEDIIEEIVGDIDDEYDVDEDIIEKTGDNEYLIDGSVSLDDINDELGTELDSENNETIGGYLIDLIGEIPGPADLRKEIKSDNLSFYILSIKDRRIKRVRLIIHDPEDTEETPSDDDAANGSRAESSSAEVKSEK